MQESPTLHIALPALNEWETLPATLDCIAKQNTPVVLSWRKVGRGMRNPV